MTSEKNAAPPLLELVVARYRENLNWLRRIPRWFRVSVYNKGPQRPALPYRRDLHCHPLVNVGREAHTYLWHLCERYESLADVTVFAQGKPFDHVPDFHKILRALADNERTVKGFDWLGFIIDEDDAAGARLFQSWTKNPSGTALPLDAFWKALWGEPAPPQVTFYPSAHFAVTAETVRRRSRTFYQRALRVSAESPLAAHCFERTWDRIFDVDGIPTVYRAAGKPVYLRKTRRNP